MSASEAERLALLLEELGECQQIIGKILRHGYESYDPTEIVSEDRRPTTNRTMLEKELGDVMHCIYRMNFSNDVKYEHITERADLKGERVEKYLHHQSRTGFYASRHATRTAAEPAREKAIAEKDGK